RNTVGLLVEPRRALAGLGRLALVIDRGPDRYADLERLAGAAVLVGARAWPSGLGRVVLAILELEQRRELRVGDQPHVAAVASVSARRPARVHVRLAAPRNHAIASVTGADLDADLIDEAHVAEYGYAKALATEAARALEGVGPELLRRVCDGDGIDRDVAAALLLAATEVEADHAVAGGEQR